MGRNSLEGWGGGGVSLGVGGLGSGDDGQKQSLMVTVQGVARGGRGWLALG